MLISRIELEQEPDSNADADFGDRQRLAVFVSDAGGGPYLVISTQRFALELEDVNALANQLVDMLERAEREDRYRRQGEDEPSSKAREPVRMQNLTGEDVAELEADLRAPTLTAEDREFIDSRPIPVELWERIDKAFFDPQAFIRKGSEVPDFLGFLVGLQDIRQRMRGGRIDPHQTRALSILQEAAMTLWQHGYKTLGREVQRLKEAFR